MKFFIPLLLVAVFFRLFQLSTTPAGLYWDELDTGYQAYSLLHTGRDYYGNLFPAHLHSFADYRSSLYMYMTVPFVKILGPTAEAIRLPAVIISFLSVLILINLAGRYLRLRKNQLWIPAAIWTFAPWTLVQGRIAAESMLMPFFLLTGFALFLNYLRQGRSLSMSAVFFALTLWSYGTAKIFLPLFFALVFVFYRRDLFRRLSRRAMLTFVSVFLLISAPVIIELFSKNVSMRFGELSVFTDPVTVSEVNYRRLESSLGGGSVRTLGMQPSFLEKMVYNKFSFWSSRVISNYASALSTDFLFQTGDPQLRHNLNLSNTGQFYLIEAIAFIIGLIAAVNTQKKFLLSWLLIAPVAAVITRDGGNHGPRLLPLLPPLVFIISLGISKLLRQRTIGVLYLCAYFLSVFMAGFYLFTTYRITSASAFNSGFVPAVEYALKQKSDYDSIIFDGHNDSFLMAYLYVSQFDPRIFQASFPLPSGSVATGVEGYKFGTTYILYPGTRDWTKISLPPRTLVLTVGSLPEHGPFSSVFVSHNPDGSAAVSAFVAK